MHNISRSVSQPFLSMHFTWSFHCNDKSLWINIFYDSPRSHPSFLLPLPPGDGPNCHAYVNYWDDVVMHSRKAEQKSESLFHKISPTILDILTVLLDKCCCWRTRKETRKLQVKWNIDTQNLAKRLSTWKWHSVPIAELVKNVVCKGLFRGRTFLTHLWYLTTCAVVCKVLSLPKGYKVMNLYAFIMCSRFLVFGMI